MRLKRLALYCFRNYAAADLELHRELNLILGANAQGKTNLLEAISLLALGRSPRTSRTSELIQWGEEGFRVAARVDGASGERELQYTLDRSGKRKVTINRHPVHKVTSLLGTLRAVIFGPEDLELIKGSPEMRRRFLDVLLCQISPAYFKALQTYRRILRQRNAALKTGYCGEDMDTWDRQLAAAGSLLWCRREQAVSLLEPWARERHAQLSSQREQLSLRYRPGLPADSGAAGQTLAQTERVFLAALQAKRPQEQNQKYTLVGPHRDEVQVYIGERLLRTYGSQGQQRTAVLSLKMAEVDAMMDITGDNPILLLDDVLSELDLERRRQVLESLDERVQTFVTGTEEGEILAGSRLNRGSRRFWIRSGKAEVSS